MDLRPAGVFAKRGRDAERLLAPLGLAEARPDPGVGDPEQLADPAGRAVGLRDRAGEGIVGGTEARLLAKVLEKHGQAFEQRDDARTVDLLPQAAGRRLLEVMRLVDDE